MTGKEYLWRYRTAYAELKRIESEIASIEDLLGNVTVDPTAEHLQSSPDPDKIGKLVAKKIDMMSDLNGKKEAALDVMAEICSVIEKVDEPDDRLILQLRYVKMLSWDAVGEELEGMRKYYCLDWMMKHHRRAIRKVEEITNCLNKYKDPCGIV